MAEHICVVADESVFAGHYKCGMGEVSDGLVAELRHYYRVTFITPGGKEISPIVRPGSTVRLDCSDESFESMAAKICNNLQPALILNLGADPALISMLAVTCPCLLLFDAWEMVADKTEYFKDYRAVLTVSKNYAAMLKAEHPLLSEIPFGGITNGIDYHFWKPGRVKRDKRNVVKYMGGDGKEMLIVMACRLIACKGIGEVIDAVDTVAEVGARLIVFGTGEDRYETALRQLSGEGKLTYIEQMADYFTIHDLLGAGDFFLSPSTAEACGLMPMKAANAGCIPIVRPIGGLVDNFDERNSVQITGSLSDAIREAAEIYADAGHRRTMQEAGIACDFSWVTRAKSWVELFSSLGVVAEERKSISIDAEPVKYTPKPCPFTKKGAST